MRRLTLVHDPAVFGWRTWRWFDAEPKYVPVDVVSTERRDVAARVPGLDPATLVDRLTLMDDEGDVWRDGAAELMALWALRRYRRRALLIGHPSRLQFRRGTLNWIAGGAGEPWQEGTAHAVAGAR